MAAERCSATAFSSTASVRGVGPEARGAALLRNALKSRMPRAKRTTTARALSGVFTRGTIARPAAARKRLTLLAPGRAGCQNRASASTRKDAMLSVRSRGLSGLFTAVALALFACSTHDDSSRAGGAGKAGAGTTSGAAGGVADASPADDAKGAGGASGADAEAGTGGIIIVKPPSDAGPECVDGGRKAVTRIDLLFMIDNSS